MKIIFLLTVFVCSLLMMICGVAMIARIVADSYDDWRRSRLVDTDHEMIEGNPR